MIFPEMYLCTFFRNWDVIVLVAGGKSTLAVSLSQAGRLRQAVLKSAFEGRLV